MKAFEILLLALTKGDWEEKFFFDPFLLDDAYAKTSNHVKSIMMDMETFNLFYPGDIGYFLFVINKEKSG